MVRDDLLERLTPNHLLHPLLVPPSSLPSHSCTMTNVSTQHWQDSDSIFTHQPLLPKAAEPKDFEAAAISLMGAYGIGGFLSAPVPLSKRERKTKTKTSIWPRFRK